MVSLRTQFGHFAFHVGHMSARIDPSLVSQDSTSRLAKDAVKTHRKRVLGASLASRERVFSVCGPLKRLATKSLCDGR